MSCLLLQYTNINSDQRGAKPESRKCYVHLFAFYIAVKKPFIMPKLQAAVPAGAPPNALLRVRLPDGNEGMILLCVLYFFVHMMCSIFCNVCC